MTDDKLIIKIPINYNINLQLKNLKSHEQINPIKTHISNNYFEFIFNNLNDGKYEIIIKNKFFKFIELFVGGSEGHGGFLDRVDSTVFTSTILLLITLISGNL